MTATRTVRRVASLLVLVPVTVCATIAYVNQQPPRCNDRKSPHQTLASCNYDDDCMDNAYCWNQEGCLCKEDFIVYRNRSHVFCLKVASSLGDPCIADVQCQVTFTPNSECRDNACQCSPGSHFYEEEGRCYESVGLGQMCKTNQNCYLENTFCDTGYCGCSLQHHLSPDNSTCLKDISLHEKCSINEECITEHTRCMQVCSCRVDYVLSSTGDRCLKAANAVGDECEENSQCTEFLKNSECVEGRCKCTRNFHQRGPVCLRNVGLGARCETHRQCITSSYVDSAFTDVMNVDCVNDVCSCAPDYMLAEDLNDCIRYSDNGVTGLWNHGFASIFIYLLISSMRII